MGDIRTGSFAIMSDEHPLAAPRRAGDKPVLAAFDCTESLGDKWLLVVNADADRSYPHGVTPSSPNRYAILTWEPDGEATAEVAIMAVGLTWRQAIERAGAEAYLY